VTKPESCFICSKHRSGRSVEGVVLYEDDVVYAGHVVGSGDRVYLGHLVAEPKRHVEGLEELRTREAETLGSLVQRLALALRTSEGAQCVSSFVFGDGAVRHLHIHVVPLYSGSPAEYRGASVLDWPDAPRGDVEDVNAVCDRLRIHLSPP